MLKNVLLRHLKLIQLDRQYYRNDRIDVTDWQGHPLGIQLLPGFAAAVWQAAPCYQVIVDLRHKPIDKRNCRIILDEIERDGIRNNLTPRQIQLKASQWFKNKRVFPTYSKTPRPIRID